MIARQMQARPALVELNPWPLKLAALCELFTGIIIMLVPDLAWL